MDIEKYDAFCIDSSAFIDLHRYYSQEMLPALWSELGILIAEGKIISHRIVFNELTTNAKKPSGLSRWITPKRSSFKDVTETQVQHVASIIGRFPALIDPSHEKDQADPWIVALVLEMRMQTSLFTPKQNIAIVSQENIQSPNKIPAVCKYYGISHLSLIEFFDCNGWEFNLKKR